MVLKDYQLQRIQTTSEGYSSAQLHGAFGLMNIHKHSGLSVCWCYSSLEVTSQVSDNFQDLNLTKFTRLVTDLIASEALCSKLVLESVNSRDGGFISVASVAFYDELDLKLVNS